MPPLGNPAIKKSFIIAYFLKSFLKCLTIELKTNSNLSKKEIEN